MTKILLDENLPRPLIRDFPAGFEVSTVPDEGWAAKKNGELLAAMTAAGFEILITADKNLRFQQNLDKYPVKVVILRTHDNPYKTLKSHVPRIEKAIESMGAEDKILEVDLRT